MIMATPRVFVSSTCYDLKYIRENLKYFIENMGYVSILSDDGDVYYDVDIHTHDACLTEVSNCQLFVLIIGGRYGGKYKDSDKSITNMEYNEAVKLKIPIFTLIEADVYGQHYIYSKNNKNKVILYPAIDDVGIFEFIDEVRKNAINNAIFPFRNFTDIEVYLKKQWAGMMYKFLNTESESKRVNELFEQIQNVTAKIELYTKVMLDNVTDEDTKHILSTYSKMNDVICKDKILFRFMSRLDMNLTPKDIIRNESFKKYLSSTGMKVAFSDDGKCLDVFSRKNVTRIKYGTISDEYNQIREELKEIMSNNNVTIEQITKIIK